MAIFEFGLMVSDVSPQKKTPTGTGSRGPTVVASAGNFDVVSYAPPRWGDDHQSPVTDSNFRAKWMGQPSKTNNLMVLTHMLSITKCNRFFLAKIWENIKVVS